MKGVIYQYSSPKGKLYIGQTLGKQRKRKDKHKYEAYTKKCNTPFGNAIRKYGWKKIKKTYKILEVVEAKNKKDLKRILTEKENYYIKKFDTFTPKGYNVKITNQKKIGEYRNKESMYEKISNSLKGKYTNEENPRSKEIINYTTGEKYPSISEATRQTGIHTQSICRCLKSKSLTAGGFQWCYLKEDGSIDTSNLRSINRKQLFVYCPELDKTFKSAYEAAKHINKPQGKSNIRIACETGKKRYGYTWQYVDK